jgi:hypothetical protein
VLTAVVGTSMLYVKELQSRLETIESKKQEAKLILASYDSRSSDIGTNRGLILKAFAFLESNKNDFPDSYEIAKKLVNEGLQITQAPNVVGSPDYLDEKNRMEDGAHAMKLILVGIAGP